jgi:hypothetical protein
VCGAIKPHACTLSDLENTGMDIAKTRNELKSKVNRLREMEDKDELKGFNLQPLSREEMAAIDSVL